MSSLLESDKAAFPPTAENRSIHDYDLTALSPPRKKHVVDMTKSFFSPRRQSPRQTTKRFQGVLQLQQYIDKHQLVMHEMSSDGNCGYWAVRKCLSVIDISRETTTITSLRKLMYERVHKTPAVFVEHCLGRSWKKQTQAESNEKLIEKIKQKVYNPDANKDYDKGCSVTEWFDAALCSPVVFDLYELDVMLLIESGPLRSMKYKIVHNGATYGIIYTENNEGLLELSKEEKNARTMILLHTQGCHYNAITTIREKNEMVVATEEV